MATIDSDVEVLKSVVSKLDTSIEKITETSGQISRLLAVHDSRLDHQEKTDEALERDLRTLHKRVTDTTQNIIKELHEVEHRLGESGMDQHNQLSAEISGVGDRVNQLEKWKWYVMGAIVAIAVLGEQGIGIVAKVLGTN